MLENLGAGRLKLNKRGNFVLFCFILFAVLLCIRLFFLQIVQFDHYQTDTVNQYTKETVIKAKRGTIYDRNMKVLAQSATAERITINPQEIEKSKNAEKIVTYLVKTLGVNEKEIRAKIA